VQQNKPQIGASVKAKLGKWRILLLVFLAVYVAVLLVNLGTMTVQWDEAPHLNGGFLLLHGQFHIYMANVFYPPLGDLVTAGYFAVAGSSVMVGRLVSVTFAALTVLAIFEFVCRNYDSRTAFVSAVFLSTMPGIVWLARVAMIDTALLFFYALTLMSFFLWLNKHENKFLFLSGITLGLGFLAKYPILAVTVVMVATIVFLGGGYIKKRLARLPILLLTAALVALPWLILLYQTYQAGMFNQWLSVMNINIPQSLNVPAPVYYLIAMTWPYGMVHPISFVVYVLGLAGIVFLAWRRKPADIFVVIWFVAGYVFFTFVGQVQWRYIVPVFPALAISAASLISYLYGKTEAVWKKPQINLNRARFGKVAAVALIAISVFAVAFSCVDAFTWVNAKTAYNLPLSQTADYVAANLGSNESVVVLCSINEFNAGIMQFYVNNANPHYISAIWTYPSKPVDTAQANFNVNELVSLCQQKNAKYLLLFEYGEDMPYYQSTLTMRGFSDMLNGTQQFTLLTSFGVYPQKIFVYTFILNSTGVLP
jgi:4-amino-4-deoxy-L-arabinose transferase-like glycosyltransferase